MKKNIIRVCLACAIALGLGGCKGVGDSDGSSSRLPGEGFPEFFPAFSWDRVPVYQMFADRKLLTDQDVREVESTSSFICVEKQHGISSHGAADIGAKEEIKQFKVLNPDIKSLVYFNSAYAYPFVSCAKGFHYRRINDPENVRFKSFLITDPKTGELAFRESDHTHYFDVLNPELRDWWVETVGSFVKDAGGDGLFVDQMHGFSWLPSRKKPEVEKAQVEMMRMAKEAIGPDKILLLNNAAHIPELFEVGDGFMFEHYRAKLLTKEKILNDWALMKKISDAKKICVWRIGVEVDDAYTGRQKVDRRSRYELLEKISRERIAYYLAVFLIGAQEYSYFQYGWGWTLHTGPLCGYPEFKKPLGKPMGGYVRPDPKGWKFQREFEHASVAVDLEKCEGSIAWRSLGPHRKLRSD